MIFFIGHLSYINYVRMEHWYNNAVVKGFCEMLIESMLYSQIYKIKFYTKALHAVSITQHPTDEFKGTISFQKHNVINEQPTRQVQTAKPRIKSSHQYNQYYNQSTSVTERVVHSPNPFFPRQDPLKVERTLSMINNTSEVIKRSNPNFQYTSFLRLRNLFFLCLMLKSNPTLRKFRHHYLVARSKEQQANSDVKVGKFSESLNKKLGKILIKAKDKLTGSTTKISKLKIEDSSFFNSDNIIENESELSSVDFQFSKNIEQFRTQTTTRQRSRRVSM